MKRLRIESLTDSITFPIIERGSSGETIGVEDAITTGTVDGASRIVVLAVVSLVVAVTRDDVTVVVASPDEVVEARMSGSIIVVEEAAERSEDEEATISVPVAMVSRAISAPLVRARDTSIFVGCVAASNVPLKFPQYISALVFLGRIAELSFVNCISSPFEVVCGSP